MRIVVTCIILLMSLINSIMMSFDYGDPSIKGIKDTAFIMTEGLNEWFLTNHMARNTLLIFCSAMMDVMTLVSFYRFARYSITWRIIMASGMFYGLRSLTTTFF